jgi:glycosyltransferase involved in cell wall biosynthesis
MKPRVSIGIPVYNGAEFLEQAIQSVLAQTYTDFELIISDNASTDGTAAIALDYAARDSRVRYSRNRVNIGSSRNFNRTFELATGQYFKWMASDDLIAPEFLENTVAALDAEPDAIIAYTQASGIDSEGAVLKHCQHPVPLSEQTDPVKRFWQFRERSGFSAWPFIYIFGLMRREVMARTRLHLVCLGGDSSFLYEMVLAGPFVEVPLSLCSFRWHEGTFSSTKDNKTRVKFFQGKHSWTDTLIGYRQLYFEYLVDILRAPITWRQKLAVLWANAEWTLSKRGAVPEQSLLAPAARTR